MRVILNSYCELFYGKIIKNYSLWALAAFDYVLVSFFYLCCYSLQHYSLHCFYIVNTLCHVNIRLRVPSYMFSDMSWSIIATQDYKASYSFKASAWHKALESTRLLESCITPQLSLPLSTHVLQRCVQMWSCHNSTFIGEHNSYSVCNAFAYTARS